MNKKPIIGLNMEHINKAKRSLFIAPSAYADSIVNAGGMPLFVPPCKDLFNISKILSIFDGFLFIGGDDYRPENYGGHAQPETELVSRLRDQFDFALARLILQETNLPVLGICGGHQLLNIAGGGGLIQDIREEWQNLHGGAALPHSKKERTGKAKDTFRHEVMVLDGSLIAGVTQISGNEILVANSFHHQAVHPEQTGKDFLASAWSKDGVIEAIEPAEDSRWKKAGRFVLGVQWHPERMQDEKAHLNVFRALVNAAQQNEY